MEKEELPENYGLLREKEMLAVTLESIGDGVITTDLQGRIQFMNRVAQELTGWSQSDALGRLVEEVLVFVDKLTGNVLESPVKRVLATGEAVGLKKNTILVDRRGREGYISANSAPIRDYDGAFIGVVVVFRDITRIITAENELKRAKEVAEIANRAKSEFLANMSHEIRTPLNGMLGMIDLTLMSDLNGEQRDNLEVSKGCAATLLNLINDILDFSKIEAGKFYLDQVSFKLKELLERMLAPHCLKAAEKGTTLSWGMEGQMPDMLYGDPVRLQQILNNLVHNAVKFTDNGGVEIRVCKIREDEDGLLVEFQVADTGIGIAPDEMDALFKSFSQVDGSITRKYGGTGLGLAISKKLVEMMGGQIWVESEKGQGSIFYFTVKLKMVADQVKQDVPYSEEKNELQSLRILVVEDDQVNQTVLRSMLEKYGHATVVAANGREALTILDTESLDLILMDIHMPELDGVETTRMIRARQNRTPIIAVTAFALKGDRERFLGLGMDGYISKPFQASQLFKEIRRVTAKCHSRTPEELPDITDKASKGVAFDYKRFEQLHEALRQAIAERKFSEIGRHAYALKSLARDCGRRELTKLAFKLLMAARKEEIAAIESLYQQLVP
jgi:PAS domain S-box-containing protein